MENKITYCYCEFCNIEITKEDFRNQNGLCKACLGRYERAIERRLESEGE